MSKPDLISVIIVNFNGGALLTESVRSVLASDVPVEVLVIDNASTDNSIYALRQSLADEERLSILENQSNLGFASANNIAAPHTKGDYLLFLNPDCIIGQDTIAQMVEIMDAHPKAGMAGSLILNVDGTEQKGCRRRVPTPWRTFVRVMGISKLLPDHPWFSDFDMASRPLPDSPVPVDAISGSFMFVRRSAMEAVGPMDEAYFLHCEDLDWCMRFRQQGYDVLFVPGVAVTHYKGVCGRDRPIRVMWHMHSGMVRFYRKFFRYKYSIALMWLVFAAVWGRFVALATLTNLRRLIPIPTRAAAMQQALSFPEPAFLRAQSAKATGSPARGSEGRILVSGASSQIGHFLVPKLFEQRFDVVALGRRRKRVPIDQRVEWRQADLSDAQLSIDSPVRTSSMIHLAPIWLLPQHVTMLAEQGVQRIVAFSSTSRYSKSDSPNTKDNHLAHRLEQAEAECIKACDDNNVNLTILRPTLVYGCGMDKNVTFIARFARLFGFFPLAGAANGLRQPVHADDLAQAALSALSEPVTFKRSYNLSGGETLSYRRMVEDIFLALGRTPRFLELPIAWLGAGLKALANIPRFAFVTDAMAQRMNEDLCFDHSDATRDFGYLPRRFLGGARIVNDTASLVHPTPNQPIAGKTVLVTGASGFIGSALCDELLKRGARVIGVVRSMEASRAVSSGVDLRVVADISNNVAWASYLQGVDCIIHLAAFVHETPTGPLVAAQKQYQSLNVDATECLAQAAVQAGVTRFIYISSVKVHGEKTEPGEAFSEANSPDPVGPYAESKLYAEYALRRIEHEHGLEVVVMRPPLVYGPGVKANFLRLIRSIERGYPLPLANVENRRSFVYLGNLVDILANAVSNPAAAGETFLVSDGEDVSTPRLIRTITYFFARDAKLIPVPVQLLKLLGNISGGTASINRLIDSLVIDNGKAKRVLDWQPPYTMTQGLEQTVQWYTERVYPLKSHAFRRDRSFARQYREQWFRTHSHT